MDRSNKKITRLELKHYLFVTIWGMGSGFVFFSIKDSLMEELGRTGVFVLGIFLIIFFLYNFRMDRPSWEAIKDGKKKKRRKKKR